MREHRKEDQWTYYMLTLDTDRNHMDAFVNFKPIHVYGADALVYEKFGYDFLWNLKAFFCMKTLYMGLQQSTVGCKLVDDIMVIDGAADPEKMEAYYKFLFVG